MSKKLKEVDLSAPIAAWLKQQQRHTVYTEVPYYGRVVDVIGRRGRHLIGVELKLTLTVEGHRAKRWPFQWRMSAVEQANVLKLGMLDVYVAVPVKPRQKGVNACEKLGIGILHVAVKTGNVEVLFRPRGLKDEPNARVLHRRLDRMKPGGIAGKPNQKGVGPAQAVERKIKAYRRKHARATWRELFENIPNHYANPNSMRQAMEHVRVRRERRRKRA